MLLANANLRNRTVRAMITPAQKKLIEDNKLVVLILRDWYGYGNDFELDGTYFSFSEEIPPEDYAVLSRYPVEHNEDVVYDYIRHIQDLIEKYRFLEELESDQ